MLRTVATALLVLLAIATVLWSAFWPLEVLGTTTTTTTTVTSNSTTTVTSTTTSTTTSTNFAISSNMLYIILFAIGAVLAIAVVAVFRGTRHAIEAYAMKYVKRA